MSAHADPSSTPEAPPGEGSRPLHECIFYSGVLILACGLISAALIYLFAPDSGSDTREIEFANPRAYEFQIERLGGKAAVYAVRFNEWFSSLWHGRQLAFTVAVLSIAIALVCFWVAHRMSVTMQSAQDKGRVE
jgi:hypothetical protein